MIEKKKIKRWSEYFLLTSDGRFLTFYDTFMIIIRIWGSATAAYYSCFESNPTNWYIFINYFVFVSFLLDLIFNCCRQYKDNNGSYVNSHLKILFKYAKSGWLFLDILATIPFQMFSNNQDFVIRFL